jgi:hypothetical protein
MVVKSIVVSNLFLLLATVAISSAQEMTTASSTSVNGINFFDINDSVPTTTTTTITIQYEYQLEVNQVTNFPTASNDKNDIESSSIKIQYILDADIDNNLLETLQSMLPYGGITAQNNENSMELPNIRFVSATSDLYSACFTESDICGLVRTTVAVEYDGIKPLHAVERAALQLIQEYLNNISQQHGQSKIIVTYLYPLWVECLIQFRLSPVVGRMDTDVDMTVMTTSFMEVVGATVAAMEGDTEIKDIQLLYQDLIEEEDEEGVAINTTNSSAIASLSAEFIVLGICRDCSDTEFASIVHSVVPSHVDAYRSRLQENGNAANSSYFSTIDRVVLTVPQPLSDLEPIEDVALYDTQVVDITYTRMPVIVILGMFFAVCIIVTGLFFIWKEIQDGYEYEKDDGAISTASESVLDDDDEEVSAERPDYNFAHHRQGLAVQEYNVQEKEDPVGMVYRTPLNEYQVETVLSNEGNPMEDGHVQSYAFQTQHSRQQRQWPRMPESHQAHYFSDDDWAPIPARPPKGARRTSATVSPATGMPYYTYVH